MMANINSKYHLIGAKCLTRTICKQCVVCRMAAARTGQQSMSQLPSSRVTPGSVFKKLALTMQVLSLLRYSYSYSTSDSSEDLYLCTCLYGCQGCSSRGSF